MSVVGLSPTDIVNGILVLAQAIQALDNEDGSKGRFQQENRNAELRISALKALNDFASCVETSSSSNSIQHVVKEVLEQEVASKGRLDRYNPSLGLQAPLGRIHGIPAKLKWAFGGAQQQRERNTRSAPGIDAAVLGSIVLGAETSKQRDEEHLAALTVAAANIQRDAEIHASNTNTKLTNVEDVVHARFDDIEANFQRLAELSADKIVSKVQSTEQSLTLLFAKIAHDIQENMNNHDARMRIFEQRLEEIFGSQQHLLRESVQLNLVSQEIKNLCRPLTRPDNTPRHLNRSHSQAAGMFQPENYVTTIYFTVLTVSCILYGHSSSKKAIQPLISQVPRDSILVLLAIFVGCFLARRFANVPIPAWIGDNLTLRSTDPFGTWPRLRANILRDFTRIDGPIGNLFIYSAPQRNGLVTIGMTRHDVTRQIRDHQLRCRVQPHTKFEMAGVKGIHYIERLLLAELRLAQRRKRCDGCGFVHNQLFEVDMQVAIKVAYQVIEITKTGPKKREQR